MPEPVTLSSATTYISVAGAIPVITVLGVPLGLRPDVLIAGFAGSVVAITLLNTVPMIDASIKGILSSTVRRMFVAFASSLTAGYLTPLSMLLSAFPEPLLLSSSFLVGGGAQYFLAKMLSKYTGATKVTGGTAQ